MNRKILLFLMLSVIVFTITGCASPVVLTECVAGLPVAGFWSGLWHGMTLPWSIIGTLISDNIAIWAVVNSGMGYDIGFYLGSISVIFTAGYTARLTYQNKG